MKWKWNLNLCSKCQWSNLFNTSISFLFFSTTQNSKRLDLVRKAYSKPTRKQGGQNSKTKTRLNNRLWVSPTLFSLRLLQGVPSVLSPFLLSRRISRTSIFPKQKTEQAKHSPVDRIPTTTVICFSIQKGPDSRLVISSGTAQSISFSTID